MFLWPHQRVELWAEGKAGNVHLEIESISVEAAADQVVEVDDVTYLATFDGAKGTSLTWKNQDDPVMGGASTSSFVIKEDTDGKYGVFNGTCAIVGYLKAPGFAKITTESTALNDASAHIKGALEHSRIQRISTRIRSQECAKDIYLWRFEFQG